MKVEQLTIADYKLHKISLAKSIFQIPQFGYQPMEDLEFGLNIGERNNLNDKSFIIPLSVQISEEQTSDFIIQVTMEGHFETLNDEPSFPLESFCKIGAPAIIFPYIRQHVRALSLDAGFTQPIILPIVNFVPREDL